MTDYQTAKIYSIRSPNNEKYYIGSTTQQLCRRLAQHKVKTNSCSSKEIINSGGAYIELIENYSCNNKEELNKREGEIIRQFKDSIINKQIPLRTKQEYNIDNKDRKNERSRKWKHNNKDKINKYNNEYKKEYNKKEFKCECGSITNLSHKSRHEKTIKHINYINNI